MNAEQALPFPPMEKDRARLLSPLQMAFVGDTVHDLLTRTAALRLDLKAHALHQYAARWVNASAQARIAQRILPLLTEEEADILRRGRNAHAHHHAPKAATAVEYAWATGLEALLGYLYLTGQTGRIDALAPYLCGEEENHA